MNCNFFYWFVDILTAAVAFDKIISICE